MNLKTVVSSTALVFAILAGAFLAACSDDSSDQASSTHHTSSVDASATAQFHDGMRMLWEDHIAWTRLAIISIASDSPDAATTTARLLRNQQDIGDAIKPFYGPAAGDQLTALLKDHIVVAADLVSAAKAGNADAVAEIKDRWYDNGDQIGSFLGTANADHWEVAEMQSMMQEHLDLTLAEAVHYLTGDYAASIADYDEIHGQILAMADMLSDGITAQFPDKFSAQSEAR